MGIACGCFSKSTIDCCLYFSYVSISHVCVLFLNKNSCHYLSSYLPQYQSNQRNKRHKLVPETTQTKDRQFCFVCLRVILFGNLTIQSNWHDQVFLHRTVFSIKQMVYWSFSTMWNTICCCIPPQPWCTSIIYIWHTDHVYVPYSLKSAIRLHSGSSGGHWTSKTPLWMTTASMKSLVWKAVTTRMQGIATSNCNGTRWSTCLM